MQSDSAFLETQKAETVALLKKQSEVVQEKVLFEVALAFDLIVLSGKHLSYYKTVHLRTWLLCYGLSQDRSIISKKKIRKFICSQSEETAHILASKGKWNLTYKLNKQGIVNDSKEMRSYQYLVLLQSLLLMGVRERTNIKSSIRWISGALTAPVSQGVSVGENTSGQAKALDMLEWIKQRAETLSAMEAVRDPWRVPVPIFQASFPDIFGGLTADSVFGEIEEAGASRFWREWYDAMISGEPLDWETGVRIAELSETVWRSPEKLSKEIERTKALCLLEQRFEDISNETDRLQRESRLGIGGNNPPEPILEEDGIIEKLDQTISSLETLKQQMAKKAANKNAVRKSIEKLSSGLNEILVWLAKKGDLSVDQIIKWGVPIGGAALLAKPDLLVKLLEAAKTWLPLL